MGWGAACSTLRCELTLPLAALPQTLLCLFCRVADVGLGRYVLYFALYMISVEFFVFWQHRMLHWGVGYK